MCVAAIVQRITGLGFALVGAPPLVLIYGASEGVLVALVMSLLISLVMMITLIKDVDWRRSTVLVLGGALAAVPAAWVTTVVAPAWLMVLIGAAALLSLLGGQLMRTSGSPLGLRSAAVSGVAAGFLHVTSGLSGPPLVIYGLRSAWEQRSFVASLQVVFVSFSLMGLGLRGIPSMEFGQLGILAAVVMVGLVIGTLTVRIIPVRIARIAMLTVAWIGTVSVLIRGVIMLVA